MEYGHNFVRLWVWEQSKWSADTRNDFWFAPSIFERTGPGLALDGKPRFDLTRVNPDYIERLKTRVRAAQARGLYVSVMLFNGWSIDDKTFGLNNPWRGHPFHGSNNVNGIDPDSNGDGEGEELHSMTDTAALRLQERYVQAVVGAVNEYDNVLYEIANESPASSNPWQYHMVGFVRALELSMPNQHPIGMTKEWPEGSNDLLRFSPADWISPEGSPDDPSEADGKKIILEDTDHLCGICGDATWVWRSVTRGRNPVFMDLYDGAFTLDPPYDATDDRWELIRRNLGYARTFTLRMDLSVARPMGRLASSGYCLVEAGERGPRLLALLPEGNTLTLDLSAMSGEMAVEWLEIATGQTHKGTVVAGGKVRLRAPSPAPAAVFLSPLGSG